MDPRIADGSCTALSALDVLQYRAVSPEVLEIEGNPSADEVGYRVLYH